VCTTGAHRSPLLTLLSLLTRSSRAQLVVLTDPQLYSHLLRAGPQTLPKEPGAYHMFERFTHPRTPNIITSPANTYWHALRKASASAFTMANLRQQYASNLATCIRVVDHLAGLGPSQAADMDLMGQRLAIDILGAFAFDHVCMRSALPAGRWRSIEQAGDGV
jgi:cytochrome P450